MSTSSPPPPADICTASVPASRMSCTQLLLMTEGRLQKYCSTSQAKAACRVMLSAGPHPSLCAHLCSAFCTDILTVFGSTHLGRAQWSDSRTQSYIFSYRAAISSVICCEISFHCFRQAPKWSVQFSQGSRLFAALKDKSPACMRARHFPPISHWARWSALRTACRTKQSCPGGVCTVYIDTGPPCRLNVLEE